MLVSKRHSKCRTQFLRLVLLTLSTLAVAGCVEKETKVIVRADGTGIIQQTSFFSVKTQQEYIHRVLKDDGSPNRAPTITDLGAFKEQIKEFFHNAGLLESFANKYGPGAKFVESQFIERKDGKVGFFVEFSFNDINTLHLPIDRFGDDFGMMLKPNPTVINSKTPPPRDHYTFTYDSAKGALNAAFARQPVLQMPMKGLYEEHADASSVRLLMQFEAPITESNADFVEGQTVTLLDVPMASLKDNNTLAQFMGDLAQFVSASASKVGPLKIQNPTENFQVTLKLP